MNVLQCIIKKQSLFVIFALNVKNRYPYFLSLIAYRTFNIGLLSIPCCLQSPRGSIRIRLYRLDCTRRYTLRNCVHAIVKKIYGRSAVLHCAAPRDSQISFRLTPNERRDTLETTSRKIGTQVCEIRRMISLTISNERGLLKRVCLIGALKSLTRFKPLIADQPWSV